MPPNPHIHRVNSNAAKPPKHLADMRRVYESDDFENDTPAQRELRGLKLKDFEAFLKHLNQYEKDFAEERRRARQDLRAAKKANAERKAAAPPSEVVKKGPDAGTMCALELIEKLLREVP